MLPDFLIPLKESCLTNLLDTKWLLAPNLRIANQWKDQLNKCGVSTVNLNPCTLKGLAYSLSADEVAKQDKEVCSSFQEMQIVADVFSDLLESNRLKFYGTVQPSYGIFRLLSSCMSELRLADICPQSLNATMGESADKLTDLALLYGCFLDRMQSLDLVDYAWCIDCVKERVKSDQSILPMDLVFISPLELSQTKLESEFQEAIVRSSRSFVAPRPACKKPANSIQNITFKRSLGAVNEIEGLFQALLAGDQPKLDEVELLHTDYSTYVPMVIEQFRSRLDDQFNSIEQLPITFGEGVSCIYSRPGRALRAWVRWIKSDYLQSLLVRMVREGLIDFKSDFGFASMASQLRRLAIGFGKQRYLEQLEAEYSIANTKYQEKLNHSVKTGRDTPSDYSLRIVSTIKDNICELLEIVPNENDCHLDVLAAARTFLSAFSRCSTKLDTYAKAKLLDEIQLIENTVNRTGDSLIDVWDWLAELPVDSKVLGSGPRPGCVHVDHVNRGGHSSRKQTWIMGMDDSRHPVRYMQDPILLDFERQEISESLVKSTEKNVRANAEFETLIDRITGDLTFTYSTYCLSKDRDQFPSSSLLKVYRWLCDDSTKTLEEFEESLDEVISFCPNDENLMTHAQQWWHSEISTKTSLSSRREVLESGYSHFRLGREAVEHRSSNEFTQYDGYVPEAGKTLDPTSGSAFRTSPSRLEAYGTCPRKFFFSNALRIEKPEEHVVDIDVWLDALQLGTLVHDVFEKFMRNLTLRSEVPSLKQHQAEILDVLNNEIVKLKQAIPVPNEDAFQSQLKRLEKTCEIFLRHEEEYCREKNVIPWVFEANIGLPSQQSHEIEQAEPAEIHLSDGRVIKIAGKVDRIDRIGGPGSNRFAIWDYKSGSDYGFKKSNPFNEGRKLQHYLYAGMLRHRLLATQPENPEIELLGYFFPSPKTNGLRLSWTPAELRSGDELLIHICDSIASGAFPATTDKNDCRFCDFKSICGEPETVAASSLANIELAKSPALNPFRKLREIEPDKGLID